MDHLVISTWSKSISFLSHPLRAMQRASATSLQMTDFPNKGDDMKITLRNSERPQFDHAYAQRIKDDRSRGSGGNIRGNEAFTPWSRARDGEETEVYWIGLRREKPGQPGMQEMLPPQVNHPPCQLGWWLP